MTFRKSFTVVHSSLWIKRELRHDERNGDEWKAFINAKAKLTPHKTGQQVKQQQGE